MKNKVYKYHYIYKTVCNVNQKYYIGMHSTDNLEDGYLGSGKRLRYTINKYGRESLTLEILEFLPCRKTLREREKDLVNLETLKDPLCLNLAEGGGGGWGWKQEHQRLGAAAGSKERLRRMREVPGYREDLIAKLKKGCHRGPANHRFGKPGLKTFLGRKHTEETKSKMRESTLRSQYGKEHPQLGSFWITDGITSIKCQPGNSIPDGWKKGRVIKSR